MRLPDLSDIPEMTFVDEGVTTRVEIVKAKDIKSTKTGREAIMLVCEFPDIDNANTMFHNMWMPMASDDAGKKATMLSMIKEFITAIGLDPEDSETEDFVGLSFDALIGQDEYQGQIKNIIRKVIG